tara:strand:- start:11511 stop:11705 length:195 start_codon:yes stop_codon:yes gene_type:complete
MKKLLLRRGEVCDLLGISNKVLTKFVAAGLVKPRKFPGCRAFYYRPEIERLVEPTPTDEQTQPA